MRNGVGIVVEHLDLRRCRTEQAVFLQHDPAQSQHAQADAKSIVLVLPRNVEMRTAGLQLAHEGMGRGRFGDRSDFGDRAPEEAPEEFAGKADSDGGNS